MGRRQTLSRRNVLRASVGTTAAAASASAAGAQETHTVDMTDDLVFDPDDVTVAPGDTVVWENVGTIGHSVTAYEAEIPGDAEYFASGGFDDEEAARTAYSAGDPDSGDVAGGESYQHTFEVVGTYDYFCIPHEAAGMLGTVEVVEGGGGGDGGPVVPVPPSSAVLVAVATTLALVTTLGLVYFFMKYGGDYGFADEE